jgi:hypothetical protein
METRGNTVLKWEYGLALGVAALLVALKLAGVLAWSWPWVLAPLWIAALLAAIGTLAGAALCRFGTAPVVAGPPLKALRWRRRRLGALRRRLPAHSR